MRAASVRVEQRGIEPVLIVARPLRRPLRKLLALTDLALPVLCTEEIGPQVQIDNTEVVNLESESQPLLGA